jgi:hypothetical protein
MAATSSSALVVSSPITQTKWPLIAVSIAVRLAGSSARQASSTASEI